MDKKLAALMLLFFLAFGLFISRMIFNQPLTQLTRAKEDVVASDTESLIFAWPLSTQSGSNEKVEINVFVRNIKNNPLANKKVNLQTTLGNISENDIITDKAGKATFNLTSQTSGVAELTATVDDSIQLKQKISVKFD